MGVKNVRTRQETRPLLYDVAMETDDLLRLVSTPMPFGKHKGVMIADLPGNYLNWFAREGFPKSNIGRLLALMQEIDHNGLGDLLKPLRQNQR
jgi:uncharacterized protein